MEIVFVRHGATEWNLRHRLQGGTDRALSETGENQALALRKAIAFWPRSFVSLRSFCEPEKLRTCLVMRSRYTFVCSMK
ncbi:histidine phosphatase family protein [Trueperella bonasi]|uniref:histidine phosphatase family protein n=1 Tax=Trueperella bonasi TaxID=312286 RepID=UPI00389ABD5F